MTLFLNLSIGLREIWSHKFRSMLTMLGVILGVASLLAMFALVDGMAASQLEFMQQLGGVERVSVISQEVPQHQLLMQDISPGRTVRDAEAIQRCIFVNYVTPVYEIPVTATRAGRTDRNVAYGCWPDYVPINKHVIEHGRNITQIDHDEARRVCVIGRRVIDELWPDRPDYIPLGETLNLSGRPFVVVGVFERYEREEDKRRRALGMKPAFPGSSRRGGRSWDPFRFKNGAILIPFTTAFYEFKSALVAGSGNDTVAGSKGQSSLKDDQGPQHRLDQLTFQVTDISRMQEAIEQIGNLLRETHRGVEDYTFDTRQEWADQIKDQMRIARMSGTLISSIALIVGGIGIMNIMLASITERIREIGVRRAVGARRFQIFSQILVESGTLGFIGGLLGLVAAAGVLQLLKKINPAGELAVTLGSVLISFGFAVIIGVVSGIYPAWKASHIEPIEALRYG